MSGTVVKQGRAQKKQGFRNTFIEVTLHLTDARFAATNSDGEVLFEYAGGVTAQRSTFPGATEKDVEVTGATGTRPHFRFESAEEAQSWQDAFGRADRGASGRASRVHTEAPSAASRGGGADTSRATDDDKVAFLRNWIAQNLAASRDTDIQSLLKSATVETFSQVKGGCIVEHNKPLDHMYIIMKGHAYAEEETRKRVMDYRENDLFGEHSITFTDVKISSTIQAEDTCTCVKIAKSVIADCAELQDPFKRLMDEQRYKFLKACHKITPLRRVGKRETDTKRRKTEASANCCSSKPSKEPRTREREPLTIEGREQVGERIALALAKHLTSRTGSPRAQP